jgi:hypothetical protein
MDDISLGNLDAVLRTIAVSGMEDRISLFIQQLTNKIVQARPGLKSTASSIAQKIAEGRVESLEWEGAVLDCDAGASTYINFASNANQFAFWDTTGNGTEGTVGSNTAGSNQIDIITWFAFNFNTTLQAITLDELFNLGRMNIQYGEQTRPVRTNLPLSDALVNRFRKDYLIAAANTELNALYYRDGNSARGSGNGFAFDGHEPMIVIPGDSRPLVQISGLTGTIAGTSPAITLQMHARGYRVRM